MVWVAVFCILFIFSITSCSKGNPMEPSDFDAMNNPLTRWAFWGSDGVVTSSAYEDQNVDVTNVIMGERFMEVEDPLWGSTNGTRGYILKEAYHIPDDQHDAEMNVVAYTRKIGAYWDVWFRVFVDGAPAGNEVLVDKPINGDALHPAVTAWIQREEEGGGLLVVEIVYQLNRTVGEDIYKSIYRVQYTQNEHNNYSSFDDTVPLHAVCTGNQDTSYLHPDVVYATYWESYYNEGPVIYDIDRVYLTYELLDNGGRYILYSYCSPLDDNPSYTSEYVYDADDGPGWYPRVDASIDLANDEAGNGHPDYKVEFVWHVYTEEGVSVYYNYKTLNIASSYFSIPVAIDDMEGDDSVANGVPYIDIDPLENRLVENRENYAHIVWSKVKNEYFTDVEPYYINSAMIEDSVDPVVIYDTDDLHIEGLPVISTYADQTTEGGDHHGTVEFISYSSSVSDYPVYGVDFWLDGDDENDPLFSTSKTIVSINPHYSSDAGPP